MKRGVLFLGVLALSILIGGLMTADADPVKLSVWTHQRHMMGLFEDLFKEFNSSVGKDKGIELSLRVVGDDANTVFLAAQENGNGPDLYNCPTGYANFASAYEAGAQIYFDDLPGFAEWKKQWPSWYWVDGMTTYKGHVYAVPNTVYNARLVYNKDLFKAAGLDPNKPPKSYADVRTYAKKITKYGKGKQYGFAWCGGDTWPNEWMPSQFAEANGEPCWWDWKTGRWNMKGYERIFQLILDLKKDGSLFPGVASLGNDPLRAQFAEGNVGMFMAESWDVGVLNDQFPAKCNWGVAPIPTYDGKFNGKPRAMMFGGLWNINGKTKYKNLAWEAVKWFNRYETRARFYEEGKYVDPDPVVVKKYAKKKPTAKGFAAFAETGDQDYVATYPNLPGFVNPTETPCNVFQGILAKGGNLKAELARIDKIWNDALDAYLKERPEVKGWNTYPNFNRKTGDLGQPVSSPK